MCTTVYSRSDERVARVSNMACGKISLARGIQCCPKFFYFFCPTSIFILWWICIYIHVSDCLETVYELPLPPNSTSSETFYRNSGAAWCVVGWIFTNGAPAWRWLGEYVTSDGTFYSLRFKQEVAAALVNFHIFFLVVFLRRPLLAI